MAIHSKKPIQGHKRGMVVDVEVLLFGAGAWRVVHHPPFLFDEGSKGFSICMQFASRAVLLTKSVLSM